MNVLTILIVGILVVGLVVFLVYKNIKDEAKFEEEVKNMQHPVHPIHKDKESDIVLDELEEGIH